MMLLKRGRERSSRYLWDGAWRCRSCSSVIALGGDDWRRWKKYRDDRDGEKLRTNCPVCEAERWFEREHGWTNAPAAPGEPGAAMRMVG